VPRGDGRERPHSREILEDNDFFEFKISRKAFDVFLAVAAYQQLAEACDYPLHLGITEAGGLRSGTVKSSIGLGMLLWSGIGDTIRVSLSADPVEEVKAGFEMLKSLNLRRRGVTVFRARPARGSNSRSSGPSSGSKSASSISRRR
jgi:(E)-4-hydroxy-3-methylbut-2-enyl-diphosphate synthase